MSERPASVLFVCTMNAVRSPMAEAMLKFLHGRHIYVDSVGVRAGELDPLAVEVLDELGMDMAKHQPKSLDELEDQFFDLVISLSPEAQHSAVELTRDNAVQLEFWHMPDPTVIEGTREQRLHAYRELRDMLLRRIEERFPQIGGLAVG